MKKHMPTIVSLLSCGLTVLCLLEISGLQNQVTGLQNQLSNQVSVISQSVGSISYQVQSSLEEQASILSASEWSFGEADMKALTIPFTYTATPKVLTPGVTTASLVCNDTVHPMAAREDGSFSVTLDWPLFEELHLQRVVFAENGAQTIEALDARELPFEQAVKLPYALFPVTVHYGHEELHYEGEIQVDNFPRDTAKSMTLVVEQNGTELHRIPLEDIRYGGYYNATVMVDFSLPRPANVAWILFLDVETTTGLRYRLPLDETEYNGSGEPAHSTAPSEHPAEIYDAQGNLLWSNSEYYY